jgi:hypothetical protein
MNEPICCAVCLVRHGQLDDRGQPPLGWAQGTCLDPPLAGRPEGMRYMCSDCVRLGGDDRLRRWGMEQPSSPSNKETYRCECGLICFSQEEMATHGKATGHAAVYGSVETLSGLRVDICGGVDNARALHQRRDALLKSIKVWARALERQDMHLRHRRHGRLGEGDPRWERALADLANNLAQGFLTGDTP